MPKNRPKIYTEPPNSGYGYKHRAFTGPPPPRLNAVGNSLFRYTPELTWALFFHLGHGVFFKLFPTLTDREINNSSKER